MTILIPRRSAWRRQPQFEIPTDPQKRISTVSLPRGADWGTRGAAGWSAVNTGSIQSSICAAGRGLQNTSTGYWSRANPYAGGGPLTVVIVVVPTTVSGTEGLWSIADTAASAGPSFLLQRNGADVRLYAGSAYQITFSSAAVVGKPLNIVIGLSNTTPSASGVSCSLAINGDARSAGTFSNAGAANTNEYLGSGFNGQPDGHYCLYAASNEYLPASEYASRSGNPWQISAPQTNNILIPDAAGGSVTLAIADAAHAHAADALALSADWLLTVQDATHAHTADSLAISTDWLLAIADAIHGHSAEALSLSTDWLLTIQDALHAHAADALTLGVSGSADLVIADATHAHAADALALSTDWLLAIADAQHAHAADNVVLDTSNQTPLTIADSAHGHLADGLTLSTAAWLAIADALHAHAADAPELSLGQVALAIADAVHAHYADHVVLSGYEQRVLAAARSRLVQFYASRPPQTSASRRPRNLN